MTDGIDEWTGDIHQGDAAETLAKMPADSVHMCMTSPPYYGLRDYDVDGQIGLEESLDSYIQNLVEVGDALKRVLRPDGSWWLNLGDSYCTRRRARKSGSEQDIANSNTGRDNGDYSPDGDDSAQYHNASLQDHGHNFVDKDKMLVPHRVAIALQEDGWVVRNDVTWVKPNPMPSSVKDRLNTTTEQIFHLTPEPDYWYDLDAIREPYSQATTEEAAPYPVREGVKNAPSDNHSVNEPAEKLGDFLHPAGKNPGDVFEVTTKPFPDAHFAVYPPELVEKPLKATCPPRVCAECGAPYEREVEDNGLAGEAKIQDGERPAADERDVSDSSLLRTNGRTWRDREHVGWSATCDCATDATEAGIALDPFAGAGTTLLKAKDLGRRYVGVELNPEYADLARKRVGLGANDPSRFRDESQTGLGEVSR